MFITERYQQTGREIVPRATGHNGITAGLWLQYTWHRHEGRTR